MAVFVSVVSHGHDSLIMGNEHLIALSRQDGIVVLIKDNVSSYQLKEFCLEQKLFYVSCGSAKGFGANNNDLFSYAINNLGAQPTDHFVVLNPDVYVQYEVLISTLKSMVDKRVKAATINLFMDASFDRHDSNIKRFPSLIDFARGLLLGYNPASYDKSGIKDPLAVDWCSGAFLVVRVDLYQQMGGFDERFFMYFEDVDFCRRALEEYGAPLWYFPSLKAVHESQQANKRIFSKHFYWFMLSMFKYFCKYRFRVRPKQPYLG